MLEGPLYSNAWNEKDIHEAKKLAGPILIVGASGFIGSNLMFGLRKIRDDVFGCSRNPQNSWRLSGIPASQLINCDITDYSGLHMMIDHLKPLTVFNMSAHGAYARQTDIEKIHMTNYIGTMHLIRALSDTGCNAFVQAGTSSEYGLNCDYPGENDELIPNSDYSTSKVGCAYLIKYYGKTHGFPCVNLRLYSAYGPWEERDRLIPTLISSCLQGKLPHFVDKNISRDFVYIDDCSNAFIKTALTACKTNPGISINIATGRKTTMEEIAKIAKTMFNIQGEPVFGSMANRKWDMSNWYGDPSLAMEVMGWKYRISVEEGLKLCRDWEKEASERLKYVSVPTSSKKISTVIACYKDNRSIPILYDRLTRVFRSLGVDYEMIFVNDSSPCNDEEIIMELFHKDSHVIGISHSRNFGSQSSFVSGMEIATGDAVVLMDGDGQDPPEVITEFIKKWENGYDVVYGQRVKREAPIVMQFFYKLFYRIFKQLSDVQMPVDAGDFSLIDRKAVNQLLKFPEKDIFLRGLRAWIGFKQTGIPYVRPERLFGKSTNNLIKNIWWAKKGIFSFSMRPLYYIQTFGLLVFFATISLALFYLINYFLSPPTNTRGITTLILLILGLGSIQLISTSILGDYIAKITEEVKNRPKYIRSKIFYNGRIYDREESILEIVNQTKHSNRGFA